MSELYSAASDQTLNFSTCASHVSKYAKDCFSKVLYNFISIKRINTKKLLLQSEIFFLFSFEFNTFFKDNNLTPAYTRALKLTPFHHPTYRRNPHFPFCYTRVNTGKKFPRTELLSMDFPASRNSFLIKSSTPARIYPRT